MKYIFVIQGEGRGHLTQALAMSHILRSAGHSIEQVFVGRCKNREIPSFFTSKIDAPVTLFDSPTFDYGKGGKRGRIIKTIIQNTTPHKINKWRRSTSLLRHHIDGSDADVVINFYEPLLGIANMISTLNKPIISIGHQFLIDHPRFKTESRRESNALILRFANMICSYGSVKRLALSFYPMARSAERLIEVVPPLLRPEIFKQEVTDGDYTLGYMLNPAYISEVIKWKAQHPDSEVHIFWDQKGAPECEERMPGLWLHQINDVEFLRLMSGCRGYITTAGFESICEALYLGKPVLMIPAHVEQQINAADAELVGAGSTAEEFNLTLLDEAIESYGAKSELFREWVDSASDKFIEALTRI